MEQLKMWWNRKKVKPAVLPEGYSLRRFNGSDSDIGLWVEIAKNGLLPEDAQRDAFTALMTHYPDLDSGNIFFIEKNGVGAATVTPVVHEGGLGYVHMVACRPEHRGKGLGNALNRVALQFLYDAGCSRAFLTTDDFRLAAIRSYLSADFFPVLFGNAAEMADRWAKVLEKLGVDEADAVDEEGVFIRKLRRAGLRG